MRATESVQSETARNFSRLFNESGYICGMSVKMSIHMRAQITKSLANGAGHTLLKAATAAASWA
jgi:hypothetical protein